MALLDLRDRKIWSHRGAESFPMQSVFKLPLGIAVLQAVEAGKLKLDQPITIHRREFSLYHSPLAKAFKGESNAYPVRELIRLAAGESDNTAADILMREIGGPKTVTAMLKAGGITGMSVDRYEREFQPEIYGLPGFAWSETIDEPAYRARLAKLDPQRRQKALAAALKDQRDSSTPEASVLFLEAQAKGNWLRDPAHSALIDTDRDEVADRAEADQGRAAGRLALRPQDRAGADARRHQPRHQRYRRRHLARWPRLRHRGLSRRLEGG